MRIINIMAVSLDGKISTGPLKSDAERARYGFGCEADHAFVLKEIEHADAIITGANSVRASGEIWDAKRADGRFPHWFVLSNHGLKDDLHFWQQKHIPRVLVSRQKISIPMQHQVQNLVYGTETPGAFLRNYFEQQKIERVLLFGGGFINQIFYEEGLVDELKITVSPIIVGRKDAPDFVLPSLSTPIQMQLLSSHGVDNHLFLHYSILKKL